MNFNFGANTGGQAGGAQSKQDGFQSQLDNWGSGNHSGLWGATGAQAGSSAADLFRAPTPTMKEQVDITSTTTTSTTTTSTITTETTVESGSESDAQPPSQAATGKKRRRTAAAKKASSSKKGTTKKSAKSLKAGSVNFEEMKVKELRDILLAHGLKQWGVKAELIERCRTSKVHLVAPMKIAELQAQLVTRGLKKSGSKKELRARLIEAMNPKEDTDDIAAPPAKKRKLNPKSTKKAESKKAASKDTVKESKPKKTAAKKAESKKAESKKTKSKKKKKTKSEEAEPKEPEPKKPEPKKSASETAEEILASKLKSLRSNELDKVLLKMARCDYGLCGGCPNCGKGPSKTD